MQPDTIIPDLANPQSLNRYSYVENRPVNFNDPAGHQKEKKLTGFQRERQNRLAQLEADIDMEKELKRQDILFSRMFLGTGKGGAWTNADWDYYHKNRTDLWKGALPWRKADKESGWNLFALHVRRLSSYYSNDQKDEFVRDFALAFAGAPKYKGAWSAAWDVRHGPAIYDGEFRSFLMEGNGGLPDYLLDKRKSENQSHHYTGLFFLSYTQNQQNAEAMNMSRDSGNYGDILLGNLAARDATEFRNASSPSALADILLQYTNLGP